MKITIVINSLVQGGAQRFTVDLLKELLNRNFQLKIVIFYPEETDFFEIPEGVEVERLIHPFHDNGRSPRVISGFPKSIQMSINRMYWRLQDLKSLKALLVDEESQLTLCVERYVGVLVGLVHPKSKPFIVSERVHPEYHQIPFPFNKLSHLVYRRKNLFIHAQGEIIANAVSRAHRKRAFVIPNAVPMPTLARVSEPESTCKQKRVVSVGRYAHQKGFDLLIAAWNLLPSEVKKEWRLEIYGDGDRSQFSKLLEDLELDDSVFLYDATREIPKKLREADIFILPSRYEGFPNALAEAMAMGIPCIATDSPSAVRDLTLQGELAILCEINASSMANELYRLINDDTLRKNLGFICKKVTEIYSPAKITDQWISHFSELTKKKKIETYR